MSEKTNPVAIDPAAEIYIDPTAPTHKRQIEYPINNTPFEFTWTRMAASELLYVISGQKQSSEDTMIKGFQRMLVKTVDSSQKGLLLDTLNNKANYTLARKIVEETLSLITDNATNIGTPITTQDGDIKRFTIFLTTDGEVERFDFMTNRVRFDDFQMAREDAGTDTADEIHNFLSNCLDDKEQRARYNQLVYDERNFTLSVKIHSRVNSFLSRNQAITGTPILRKSPR